MIHKSRKHLVIPDCQVTPDTPTDHLKWIGQYIVDKRPDVIVNIGDFADMESLSSYDVGKGCYQGRTYKRDIDASKSAMDILMSPLKKYNAMRIKNKKKRYNPSLHLTLGNHENRITRAINDDPKLDGFMSVDDLCYESYGWKVHPFLSLYEADGVSYTHYFANPGSGKALGGENILYRIIKSDYLSLWLCS